MRGQTRSGEPVKALESHFQSSYSLCSDDVGTSSAGTCVFCRRSNGMPPLFFGAKLGHRVGCTMLMQSVCAFALQPRQRTPCRLWPRNTWPHASQGVILRYVYSRQVCPPSDSRLFLQWQRSSLSLSLFPLRTRDTIAGIGERSWNLPGHGDDGGDRVVHGRLLSPLLVEQNAKQCLRLFEVLF